MLPAATEVVAVQAAGTEISEVVVKVIDELVTNVPAEILAEDVCEVLAEVLLEVLAKVLPEVLAPIPPPHALTAHTHMYLITIIQ